MPVVIEPIVEETIEDVVEEEVVEETIEDEFVEDNSNPVTIDDGRPTIGPFPNPYALSERAVRQQFNMFEPPIIVVPEEITFPPFKFSIKEITRNALVTIKPSHPVHRPSFLDSIDTQTGRRQLLSMD